MPETAQTDMVSATGSAEGGFLLSTLQSMANWSLIVSERRKQPRTSDGSASSAARMTC